MDHETNAKYGVLERPLLDASAEPTNVPLSLLKDITNGFSHDRKIGSGGFAVLYMVCYVSCSAIARILF